MKRTFITGFIISLLALMMTGGLQDMDTHWARLDDYYFRIYPTDNWLIHKTEPNKVIIKNRGLDLSAELTVVVHPINLPGFDYLSAAELRSREDELIDNFLHAFPMYKNVKVLDRSVTNWTGTYVYEGKTITNRLGTVQVFDIKGKKFDKSTWQNYHARVFMIGRNRYIYHLVVDCPIDHDIDAILHSARRTLDAEHLRVGYDPEYCVNTPWNYSFKLTASWTRETNNSAETKFIHESDAMMVIRSSRVSVPNLSTLSSNNTSRIASYVEPMRAIDIRGWKSREGITLVKERTQIVDINGAKAIYDMAKYQVGDFVFDEYNILLAANGIKYHIIVARERLPDEPSPISQALRLERRAGRHVQAMVNSFAAY